MIWIKSVLLFILLLASVIETTYARRLDVQKYNKVKQGLGNGLAKKVAADSTEQDTNKEARADEAAAIRADVRRVQEAAVEPQSAGFGPRTKALGLAVGVAAALAAYGSPMPLVTDSGSLTNSRMAAAGGEGLNATYHADFTNSRAATAGGGGLNATYHADFTNSRAAAAVGGGLNATYHANFTNSRAVPAGGGGLNATYHADFMNSRAAAAGGEGLNATYHADFTNSRAVPVGGGGLNATYHADFMNSRAAAAGGGGLNATYHADFMNSRAAAAGGEGLNTTYHADFTNSRAAAAGGGSPNAFATNHASRANDHSASKKSSTSLSMTAWRPYVGDAWVKSDISTWTAVQNGVLNGLWNDGISFSPSKVGGFTITNQAGNEVITSYVSWLNSGRETFYTGHADKGLLEVSFERHMTAASVKVGGMVVATVRPSWTKGPPSYQECSVYEGEERFKQEGWFTKGKPGRSGNPLIFTIKDDLSSSRKGDIIFTDSEGRNMAKVKNMQATKYEIAVLPGVDAALVLANTIIHKRFHEYDEQKRKRAAARASGAQRARLAHEAGRPRRN